MFGETEERRRGGIQTGLEGGEEPGSIKTFCSLVTVIPVGRTAEINTGVRRKGFCGDR